MISSLNFNHLYYFYVVGKAQGLTEAANLLSISQPSLSAQMKVLENRLGLPLFKKVGRRLILSPEGHQVFAACEKMFSVAENLEKKIRHETDGHKTLIRLGVSADIERPFAVDIVSRAFLKDKRVKVRFLSGTEAWLQKELQIGNFDFVLMSRPHFSENLRVLSEINLPVVAGISKKILRTGERPKTLKDLPDRWVSPAPHQKLRKETETFFEKKRISPTVSFESDVMGALIRAISDGIGWGLFPKVYLRHESLAKNLVILGPKEGFWVHKLYLVANKSPEIPKEFESKFSAALVEECNT